jgi:hypothetical protein
VAIRQVKWRASRLIADAAAEATTFQHLNAPDVLISDNAQRARKKTPKRERSDAPARMRFPCLTANEVEWLA